MILRWLNSNRKIYISFFFSFFSLSLSLIFLSTSSALDHIFRFYSRKFSLIIISNYLSAVSLWIIPYSENYKHTWCSSFVKINWMIQFPRQSLLMINLNNFCLLFLDSDFHPVTGSWNNNNLITLISLTIDNIYFLFFSSELSWF